MDSVLSVEVYPSFLCVLGDQGPGSVTLDYYGEFTHEFTHFLALPKQKSSAGNWLIAAYFLTNQILVTYW